MMQARAFDTYSVTNADFLKAMKADNFTTAIRYYRVKPEGNGVLSVPELLTLLTEGFDVVPVFEVEKTNPNVNQFNYDLGRGAATNAYKYANEVIRQPFNSAIYFAVDFNATQKQIDGNIVPYFTGVKDAMTGLAPGDGTGYDIGVYGNGATCATLLNQRAVSWTWLSNSSSFEGTSGFASSGKWDLMQKTPETIHGLQCDRNFIGPQGCGAFGSRVIKDYIRPRADYAL